MSNELLKVNIQKKLKEFDLNVDFELKKGCLGILGPSGCGKSMTLKSVAGIVNPDNGVISLTTNDETVYYVEAKAVFEDNQFKAPKKKCRILISKLCIISEYDCRGKCCYWFT